MYVVAAVHSFTFSVRSRNGESVHSSSVKKLDEKSSVVPDPETECVKKFGMMCTTDLHHTLKLCGLIPGQENVHPAMEQGKSDSILPGDLQNGTRQSLQGGDDTHSAAGAMKGLSSHMMVE